VSSKQQTIDVDVIILGGSMTASVLALTLKSQGLNVAMLDAGSHPRFSLGESLLKPTVFWMRLLAKKFNLPALDVLADLARISNEIAPTSGVKRCFGFVRHGAGKLKVEDQWFSNVPVSYDEDVLEGHLFRQDTDAYLFTEAINHAVATSSGQPIEKIAFEPDHVSVCTPEAEYLAHYLVDCGSAKSLVAEQLKLREEPCRWLTQSRSIFTHMVGVKNFEDCHAAPQAGLNWSQGTLHHLLEDAWVWVIPFNNYAKSKNPRVSVGVTFFGKRCPPSDLTPQAEWQALLSQYPALMAQFGTATAVRPWIGTGKLAYSSRTAIGPRYCLLGQSYGGIDALYSRGLLNTMQCVNLISDLLCDAVKQQNFSTAQFAPIQLLQDNLLEINDLLTHGSYLGFASSRLTTWWLSLWTQIEQLSIKQARQGLDQLDVAKQKPAEQVPAKKWDPVSALVEDETVLNVLRAATTSMQAYEAGDLSEKQTCEQLLAQTEPLAEFGFDIRNSEQLLNRVLFNKDARNLLQCELELTTLLDDLGNAIQSQAPIKAFPGVQTLVRFLSTQMMKQMRAVRNKASADGAEDHYVIEFTSNELTQLLRETSTRLELDDAALETVNAITDGIESISLSVTTAGQLAPTDNWTTHLKFRSTNAQLECMTSVAPDKHKLLIQSATDKQILQVICQVTPEVSALVLGAGDDSIAQYLTGHSVG
jgi:tetracycline 7-halogenase / FADH2 O2-dependent halogenase